VLPTDGSMPAWANRSVESALSQELIGGLEKHLAGCEPCRSCLNTYQRTRALTAETERIPMPEGMNDRLRQFLLRALSSRP
jgi:hypothetical protein